MRKLSIYDLWSVVLIGILTYFSLPYWRDRFPLFCEFYDIFYHLSISNDFFRAGGLFIKQIYPPFLHILESLFLNAGISSLTIANYLTWSFYPLSFVTLWLFMRSAFSPRAGFYAVLLLSVPSVWLEKTWGYQANALLLILTPLALWAMVARRHFTAVILTFLCLITNVSGIFVVLTLIIYALYRRRDSKLMLWLLFSIMIFAVPIALVTFKRIYEYHILWKPLSFSLSALNKIIEPQQYYGFLGLVGVIGFFLCYRLKGNYLILPAYFLANLPPLLLNYSYRFWLNILLPLAMLSAIFLDGIHKKISQLKKGRLYSAVFFIVIIPLSNFLFTQSAPFPQKEKQSALMTITMPRLWTKYRLLVTQEEKLELAKIIKNNSAEDEAFFIDSNENVIKMLSALSSRSATGSIDSGNRIIIVKEPIPNSAFIKKVGIFSVYKEADANKIKKVILPKPVISLRNIKIIFLVLGLIGLADLFYGRRRKRAPQ